MNIIRNPVYKGTMAQGKRKVLSFKNKKVLKNPSDTWIVVEDTHEAIISKSIWEVSQRHEKLIKEKEYRLKKIDSLIQSLFEEKVSGNVPENIFKRMAKKYDDEQLSLAEEIESLKNELTGFRRNENDVVCWVSKIKKCLSIEELTREIVVELIDSIEIPEVDEVDGKQHQDINITYRFENLQDKEKRTS